MMFDFAPALPFWLLGSVATIIIGATLYGTIKGAKGLIWRALAVFVLLIWIAGPRSVHPVYKAVPQDALLIVDQTPSMQEKNRNTLADKAAAQLTKEATQLPGLTLHRINVSGGDNHGTRLFHALTQADIPRSHFAGAIVITDGMDHDVPHHLPSLFQRKNGSPLPLHLLLTGQGEETDRRLRILNTPPFAIVGQKATIRVQVDDLGAPEGKTATLSVRTGDAAPTTRLITVGQPQDITIPIQKPGETLINLSVSPLDGEVSNLNNSDVLHIRGVRDRLKVLLVSGIPNQSERVWRRLLKADPSVDLVHFTILRSPSADDDTPLSDLALIPFPVEELFQNKISSFDLIILDGFRNTNILPEEYITNIANYVRNGGGLLITAGPEFTQDGSLQNTSLAQVLPAHIANNGIITQSFRPALTELGEVHPVTAGLGNSHNWGPWYRAAKVDDFHGENIMSGPDHTPLLLLDHVDKGRVAMLLSDQLWLWARGEGGGGPQAELLRRLSHWLMKEPDLEENRLTAQISNNQLIVERHMLSKGNVTPEAVVILPNGQKSLLHLAEDKKGLWHGKMPIHGSGIWTVRQDGLVAFASPSEQDPLERQDLRATATLMGPLSQHSEGSISWIGQKMPALRQVQAGQPLSGNGWIGLPVSQAAVAGETRTHNLLSGWVAMLLSLMFLGVGWWREGR
ncbi:VWA domain-containing protein [Swingsia samuiensis]|uniref:VWA domain-containing protein n=1 Tax=Swingsia samuiensis TaxID=1293412 RepID=A0A4Y6UKB0_9PROT|nr:VWA domain-containing protein [Swingsia samuiensis]QDH16445.1 VWA domain-containing protein [Swingsia samuiensis]